MSARNMSNETLYGRTKVDVHVIEVELVVWAQNSASGKCWHAAACVIANASRTRLFQGGKRTWRIGIVARYVHAGPTYVFLGQCRDCNKCPLSCACVLGIDGCRTQDDVSDLPLPDGRSAAWVATDDTS